MTTGMDDRGKAFESKWAHDAELRFKVEARRNRALGLWAAAEKGLTGQIGRASCRERVWLSV